MITLTEAAATRINKVAPGKSLRVTVEGGGCTGFKYIFTFDDAINEGDATWISNGATIITDRESLPFLLGCEVSYVDNLVSAGFKVKNPNATSSCGCGTSFSI